MLVNHRLVQSYTREVNLQVAAVRVMSLAQWFLMSLPMFSGFCFQMPLCCNVPLSFSRLMSFPGDLISLSIHTTQ
jgi:hypothetical protein